MIFDHLHVESKMSQAEDIKKNSNESEVQQEKKSMFVPVR